MNKLLLAITLSTFLTIVSVAAVSDKDTQPSDTQLAELYACVKAEDHAMPTIVKPVYDVPLDAEVHDHIVSLCGDYDIAPEIVFGLLLYEGRYDANAVADNGLSFGLMGIRKKCNLDRMERLGVTDLLDPKQNVSVGIDLIAEYLKKYDGNPEMALMCYHAGEGGANRAWFSKGVYSTWYSRGILEEAQRLVNNLTYEEVTA